MFGAGIDHLDSLVLHDLGRELLNGDRGQRIVGHVPPPRRAMTARLHQPVTDRGPVDIPHEGIDVGGDVHAEVEMVGMFVHVERQHRNSVHHCLGVIEGDLVVEPAVPARVAQQNPARTPAEGLAEGDELLSPRGDAAELQLQRGRHRRGNL